MFSMFQRPDIDKMAAARDIDGLYRVLQRGDPADSLRAADALARLEDGAGWRYLTEALQPERDSAVQSAAAALLAELAALNPAALRRARTALEGALPHSPQASRGALREALAQIEALDDAPQPRTLAELSAEPELPLERPDYRPGFVERIAFGEGEYLPNPHEGALPMPHTTEIQFLSAETHLNNAVQLHEADLAERGLVETALSLWLKPGWAYAYYLRGVLYEELERPLEALLAYREAAALEPSLNEAREALDELEADLDLEAAPLLNDLLLELAGGSWTARRDAAAQTGALGKQAAPAFGALLAALQDEEREVRHAALAAVARLAQFAAPEEQTAALAALQERRESSWLLRFATLEALAALRSAAGLRAVLLREMERMAESVFEAQRDPLHEVDYERLMEIGALAFQRSGDLPGLLDIAEANAWEAVEEDNAGEEDFDTTEEYDDYAQEGVEADPDLSSYVDEVALMACVALERLALPLLPGISTSLLERLAAVPDLTLLDYSESETGEPQHALAYDLSGLRAAAAQARAERSRG